MVVAVVAPSRNGTRACIILRSPDELVVGGESVPPAMYYLRQRALHLSEADYDVDMDMKGQINQCES